MTNLQGSATVSSDCTIAGPRESETLYALDWIWDGSTLSTDKRHFVLHLFVSANMPTPGSSRIEYEFLDKIGDGAFGQVYRAKHKRSCQVVCIPQSLPKQLKTRNLMCC